MKASVNKIFYGDNLPVLKGFDDESVDLIYIDPPFNTGKSQKRTRIKTVRSTNGSRTGFNGYKYQTIEIGSLQFPDSFSDYIRGFLTPRMIEAYRILSPNGTLYFHIDYREVHYCKILLDIIFGRDNFLNEIIWAYDFGAKPKGKWPAKHDNILVYVKDINNYKFNVNDIDREPYLSDGLVTPEKKALGKLPTDTWWHSIVGTNSRERTGYPTQKPLGLMKRIVKASSNPEDTVLDFFAGSGSIADACLQCNRRFILVDNSEQALQVMAKRFKGFENLEWIGFNPLPYHAEVKKIA